MADVQFDTPTEAPQSFSSVAPYTRFVNYKSGKTPEAFAKNARPEDVKAGFYYYDKERKVQVAMSDFTACIVAVLSGVTGTVKNGDYYENYYSNLIFDTRTQILNVRQNGIDRPLYTGIYRDIKAQFPQGVGYTQFLIAYIYETEETVAIELTTGLSTAIQNAIAQTVGTKPEKISLFNLCDLATRFWCLKFTSDFEKRAKDGTPYTGKGEMYFMPVMKVYEVKAEKNPDFAGVLNEISEDVKYYIESAQARMAGPMVEPAQSERTTTQRTQATGGDDFPTHEVRNYEDNTPDNGFSDLPF